MSGAIARAAAWIAASDVQAWIGLDKIDQDAAATLAVIATDAVRNLIDRDLSLATGICETLDTNGTDYVLLSCWPIRSVASVTLDGRAAPPASYATPGWVVDTLNTRKLRFSGMGKLARGRMNLTVAYTAGYDTTQPPGAPAALPGDVLHALRLTATAVYASQAADPNLASESTAGVFSASFHPTGVGAVPPGARSLLAGYARVAP